MAGGVKGQDPELHCLTSLKLPSAPAFESTEPAKRFRKMQRLRVQSRRQHKHMEEGFVHRPQTSTSLAPSRTCSHIWLSCRKPAPSTKCQRRKSSSLRSLSPPDMRTGLVLLKCLNWMSQFFSMAFTICTGPPYLFLIRMSKDASIPWNHGERNNLIGH